MDRGSVMVVAVELAPPACSQQLLVSLSFGTKTLVSTIGSSLNKPCTSSSAMLLCPPFYSFAVSVRCIGRSVAAASLALSSATADASLAAAKVKGTTSRKKNWSRRRKITVCDDAVGFYWRKKPTRRRRRYPYPVIIAR